MSEQNINVTDAITPEPSTTAKIQKGMATVAVAAGAVLLLVTAVKRFSAKKDVVLTVVDTPDNN